LAIDRSSLYIDSNAINTNPTTTTTTAITDAGSNKVGAHYTKHNSSETSSFQPTVRDSTNDR
ncbi:hypothetical protein BGZ99_000553, partial [Dissophora globulifera]